MMQRLSVLELTISNSVLNLFIICLSACKQATRTTFRFDIHDILSILFVAMYSEIGEICLKYLHSYSIKCCHFYDLGGFRNCGYKRLRSSRMPHSVGCRWLLTFRFPEHCSLPTKKHGVTSKDSNLIIRSLFCLSFNNAVGN